MCRCCGFLEPSTVEAMMVKLKHRDFLRLCAARGVAIEVVDGRVWITEDGRGEDSFVSGGGSYRVAGDGLVLIEAEANETAVRVSP
jgi:hypothetical protein